jgi:hypothetical protein
MYRPLRTFWGLAAIGGAIAVGLTTHNAGYIVITFIGGLIVPHVLGIAGPGRHQRHGGRFGHGVGFDAHGGRASCMHGVWDEWHRQSHAGQPATPPAPPA